MKLTLLGTAGYHPNEGRQTTCLMLPESGIVLDAGTGFFRLPQYLQTDEVDILLSHAHLDHVLGLTFLLGLKFQRPISRVRLHAEQQKLDVIRRCLFASEMFPMPPEYEECPLEEGASQQPRTVGSAEVHWRPLQHPGGSVGYRIDWSDRSLAYITDTTASGDADYLDFIRGVDLLVHECNFDGQNKQLAIDSGHSCLHDVAELAAAADVGGLVLMHFNPIMDAFAADELAAAQELFSPIVLGEDHMEIDF